MKVGPADSKPVTTPVASERKSASAAATQAQPSAKVALSSSAALQAPASLNGDFDQAKVDRIAQAIRSGNYQVNAEAIADKLIANAAELLGKTAR